MQDAGNGLLERHSASDILRPGGVFQQPVKLLA
jgi:hypothetical protein